MPMCHCVTSPEAGNVGCYELGEAVMPQLELPRLQTQELLTYLRDSVLDGEVVATAKWLCITLPSGDQDKLFIVLRHNLACRHISASFLDVLCAREYAKEVATLFQVLCCQLDRLSC